MRARLSLAVAVLLIPAGAEAQLPDEVLTLEWSAPEGCPDGDAVLAEVGRLLGTSTGRDLPAVDAVARVEPAGDGLVLTLQTTVGGEEGEREIRGESCESLASAAALVLALVIDPGAVAEATAPEPPPEPATPVQPPPVPPRVPEPASGLDAPGSSPPDHPGAAGLHLAADVGALPGLSFGFEATLSHARGRHRLEVSGRFFPRKRKELGPGVGGDFRLFTAGARACLRFLVRRSEVDPCAAAELGVMSGQGFGVASPTRGRSGWLALGGGGLVVVPATRRLWLRGSLSALVAPGTPTFDISGLGEVHRPSRVAIRLGLGAELHFP